MMVNNKRDPSFTACSACQSKHSACERSRPCARCVRLGILCTEGIPRKRVKKSPINPSLLNPALFNPALLQMNPQFATQQMFSSGFPQPATMMFTPPDANGNNNTNNFNFNFNNNINNSNNNNNVLDVETELFTPINLSSSQEVMFSNTLMFNPIFDENNMMPFQLEDKGVHIKEETTSPSSSNEIAPYLASSNSSLSSSNSSSSQNDDDTKKLMKTIKLLEEQVSELKSELAISRTSKVFLEMRPKMMCMAIWSLPEGDLRDFSSTFHDFFKFSQKQHINLDILSPVDLVEERRLIRKHYARDKPEIKGVSAVKSWVIGNGQKITIKSFSSLLHFEGGSFLQMTYWV